MLILQIVAASLLLLGSGLIFRALLEIDASERPRPTIRRHRVAARPDPDVDLSRAA